MFAALLTPSRGVVPSLNFRDVLPSLTALFSIVSEKISMHFLPFLSAYPVVFIFIICFACLMCLFRCLVTLFEGCSCCFSVKLELSLAALSAFQFPTDDLYLFGAHFRPAYRTTNKTIFPSTGILFMSALGKTPLTASSTTSF